jgi:L-iditol 2-dehydrogenase
MCASSINAENIMALTLPAVVEPSTIPDTMRAAVLYGPQDIRLLERPVPRPGPGEVLVRVAMCGTCGTDLKIYDGHFPLTLPYGAFTPGHEWTGTVVALGDAVDEFAVGERVCIEAHHGCGRCDNCLIGKYTACLNYGNPVKGHRATGMTADGGFAEYVLHHVSALYKLPAQVSFKDAVLLTTAGTGLYGLDAAGGYIAGDDIAIFGPGPVGLMTVQACKQLGAARVILVGTRSSRLEMGRRLGADHIINVRECDPVATIQGLTDGAGVDLAIECSGALETPQQCVQVTRRGGKILVVAFYPQPVTLDLSAVVRGDIVIYTTRGEGGNNVKRAVSLAAQGRLRGADLVTHEFPLEAIAEAFRVMRERFDDPIKIVIKP